jgi:hypothetical protein
MDKCLVVTSINNLSHPGLVKLINNSVKQKYNLIIIGDLKTKIVRKNLKLPNVYYYSISDQTKSIFECGRKLPVNHYARKNMGYLYAASLGSTWISETDDDNFVYEKFWNLNFSSQAVTKKDNSPWINIYQAFGENNIWHRGIPINQVSAANNIKIKQNQTNLKISCIQGLADGDPDIDAICRILSNPKTSFSDKSFTVQGPYYCPTNSQMTRWHTQRTLPLLYLPSSVPWRVSDIWRGLIAQRFFTIFGMSTQFSGAMGYQNRNKHDLLQDFIDEIKVHSESHKLLLILDQIHCTDMFKYLIEVYSTMAKHGLVSFSEIETLKLWIKDVKKVLKIS